MRKRFPARPLDDDAIVGRGMQSKVEQLRGRFIAAEGVEWRGSKTAMSKPPAADGWPVRGAGTSDDSPRGAFAPMGKRTEEPTGLPMSSARANQISDLYQPGGGAATGRA
jgi:hypothetical protein